MANEPSPIRNVISHSFGIVTQDEQGAALIRNLIVRQSLLPAIATHRLHTAHPFQHQFHIRIVENDEDSEIVTDLSRCREIGEAELGLPAGIPIGSPVEVTFTVNEQGRLDITAMEMITRRTVTASIETYAKLSEQQIESAQRDVHNRPIGVSGQARQHNANWQAGATSNTRAPHVVSTSQGLRGAIKPASIFISYKSVDRLSVEALAGMLERMGAAVWFDKRLVGGQVWWDEILLNIRAADVFIFALTPASLQSTPCRLEYEYAHALNKLILPVLLADGVNLQILPRELQLIQVVDYRTQDATNWQSLHMAMSLLPPPRPTPVPFPPPPPAPVSPLGEIQVKLNAREISRAEQADILLQLKSFLRDADTADGARMLLHQLRNHPALLAFYIPEIEGLIR